jgi:hypothetical protein
VGNFDFNSFRKVLLHGDGVDGSTTFTDTSGKVWTLNGVGIEIDTAQSKFGGASIYFPGNGSYLSTPNHADFAFAGGDFTIDFYWMPSSLRQGNEFFCKYELGGSPATDWNFRITWEYWGGFKFAYSTDGTTVKDANFIDSGLGVGDPEANKWYHVAFVRHGADLNCYFEGCKYGATYNIGTDSIYNSERVLWMGSSPVAGTWEYVKGWMDEIRFSKGVARWLGNFNTIKSLLHFDGEDASTTFTDETGKVWTPHGTAQIDTAQSVFGGASGLFDGDSDYITTPYHTHFALSDYDFTFECRARFHVNQNAALLAQRDAWNSNHAFTFMLEDNNLKFSYTTDGSSETKASFAFTPSTDTWYTIEFVRHGADLICRVNGSKIGSTYNIGTSIIYKSTADVSIGANGSGGAYNVFMNGWIEELCLTKGLAKHLEDYTVDAAAFLYNAPIAPVNDPVLASAAQDAAHIDVTWTYS